MPVSSIRPGAVLRRLRPAVLLLAALGLLAGCSIPRTEPVYQAEEPRLEVWRLTAQPARHAPPDPELSSLTGAQVDASLQRLTARLGTWISVVRTDPKPLLSRAQRERLAPVLARELPALAPDERLVMRFFDPHEGYRYTVHMHLSGRFLVYHFVERGIDPAVAQMPDREPRAQAALAEQPGQMVELRGNTGTVRDPVTRQEALQARTLRDKLELVNRAAGQGLLDEAEARALRQRVRDDPDIPLTAWRTYMRRRSALEQARLEGLFSEAEYAERLDTLEAELDAATERDGGDGSGG